jgi:hypothetical protein
MKIPGLIGRRNFVTQSPTSVAPATMMAGVFDKGRGERPDVGRHDGALVAAPYIGALRGDGRKARLDAFALGVQRVRRLSAGLGGGKGGLDDRLIARAAAEIALKRRFDIEDGRIWIRHPEPVERHDDARRAEAALAAMMFDHGLLDRVERAAGPGKRLDRHDMAAVAGGEKADAGIDGLVNEGAVMEPPDQHGAGAAIALRTALFGPFETALEAKEVEQSVARSCLADARLAIVQKEAYFAAHCVSP